MIKSVLLNLIGQKNAGRLDYLLNRKSKDAWGPLNGQSFRQRVYLGNHEPNPLSGNCGDRHLSRHNRRFFAKSGLPVYTVEIHPRAYGYALLRFRRRRHQIHAYEGDRPEFLRALANNPDFPKSKVFFYLDAHVQDSSRYHKAPLVEELEIIFTKWT